MPGWSTAKNNGVPCHEYPSARRQLSSAPIIYRRSGNGVWSARCPWLEFRVRTEITAMPAKSAVFSLTKEKLTVEYRHNGKIGVNRV